MREIYIYSRERLSENNAQYTRNIFIPFRYIFLKLNQINRGDFALFFEVFHIRPDPCCIRAVWCVCTYYRVCTPRLRDGRPVCDAMRFSVWYKVARPTYASNVVELIAAERRRRGDATIENAQQHHVNTRFVSPKRRNTKHDVYYAREASSHMRYVLLCNLTMCS